MKHAFSRDEEGAITVKMMFLTIVFLIIGGLAVDATNAFRLSATMQATADAAALARVSELKGDRGNDNA